MDKPIKIIYKVKNNNGKAQYYIYIYIGNPPTKIMKILEKIREITLYDALLYLSSKEIQDLTDYYGIKWYEYLFNKHHISSAFKTIADSSVYL